MEREDFINEILNSTNGIRKVSPNPQVFEKIKMRIEENRVSSKMLWLVAASIAILIALNLVLWAAQPKTISNEMASLEHSIHKSNQLY